MESIINAADIARIPALKNAIFFVQSSQLEAAHHAHAWNLNAQVLRENIDTGSALKVTAPTNWCAANPVSYDRALKLIVLEGSLSIGNTLLQQEDYLRIPAGAVIAPPDSTSGAQFLMFFEQSIPSISKLDNTTSCDDKNWQLVRASESPWVAGTALKDAGRDDVPLKIKHYKQDPKTGARTYLVTVGVGIEIPWEVHKVAEEAYIIKGDYTLAECLPSGAKVGDYIQGGYFYRPAGIAHNGPESGSKHSGVTMLIRTPGPLTVQLLERCPFE